MKFRIFSKPHNLYTNSPSWPSNQRTTSEFVLRPDGKILEIIDSGACGASVEICDSRNYIVEPWTGYFDSKGKKIYRGDILLLDCYNLAYEIDWKQDRFVMKPRFEASGEIPDHFRTHKDISTNWSIIGNIHDVEYTD